MLQRVQRGEVWSALIIPELSDHTWVCQGTPPAPAFHQVLSGATPSHWDPPLVWGGGHWARGRGQLLSGQSSTTPASDKTDCHSELFTLQS